MLKIISNLPKFDDQKISNIFKNCCDIVSNNKSQSLEAEMIIEAIKNEWKKRLTMALSGKYKADRPEIGMLSYLGYHVGQEGESLKKRRFILDFIINEELPLVQSPSYTAEWGDPKTKKRYLKTYKVIQFFIDKYTNYKQQGYEKAIIEWNEDIDYLKKLYAVQFPKNISNL